MSTDTIRLIRDREKGGGGMDVGEEGRLHTCHHQNDSCIKMGSDEGYKHIKVNLVLNVHRNHKAY